MEHERIWQLETVIEATGGEVILRWPPTTYGNETHHNGFHTIGIDSRTVEEGAIFVALKGERFDGHDFLEEAVRRGARCLIVERSLTEYPHGETFLSWLQTTPPPHRTVVVVRVGSTLQALSDLARSRRLAFHGAVVGVTGSNGKTSTKEMIACVLEGRFPVHKTPMNWNNNIGLPLSLFGLAPHHRVAVLELGVNHPGEMDELVSVAQPTIGVITNVHKAHLEGMESEEIICAEKTKLWMALPRGEGCAIVNRDDPRLLAASQRLTDVKVYSYSLRGGATLTVEGEVRCSRNGTAFTVHAEGKRVEVRLSVLGAHFAANSLAAMAVGYHLGVPLEEASALLSSWQAVPHRMERHILPDGTVLIDDTYNANPGSTIRAITTDAQAASQEHRPFLAVLGEMRELGTSSRELHRLVGVHLATHKPAAVFTLGTDAALIAEEARRAGVPTVFVGLDHESILDVMAEAWIPGAWVLVKGSRSMKMERIVEGLLADAET